MTPVTELAEDHVNPPSVLRGEETSVAGGAPAAREAAVSSFWAVGIEKVGSTPAGGKLVFLDELEVDEKCNQIAEQLSLVRIAEEAKAVLSVELEEPCVGLLPKDEAAPAWEQVIQRNNGDGGVRQVRLAERGREPIDVVGGHPVAGGLVCHGHGEAAGEDVEYPIAWFAPLRRQLEDGLEQGGLVAEVSAKEHARSPTSQGLTGWARRRRCD